MADDLARFWSNIRGKLDAITDIPSTHWRPDDYYTQTPRRKIAPTPAAAGSSARLISPCSSSGSPPTPSRPPTPPSFWVFWSPARPAGRRLRPGRRFRPHRVSVILGVTGTLELVVPLGARLGHPIWRRALRDAGIDRRPRPKTSSSGSPSPTSAGRRVRSRDSWATWPPDDRQPPRPGRHQLRGRRRLRQLARRTEPRPPGAGRPAAATW